VGQSLKGEDVVNALNHIGTRRGLPSIIKVDNGSEFISKVMDKWAYERCVPTLHCSGQHPLNSPARQGKMPCPAGKKSRDFLL
jgi:hypothetical protein